MVGSPPGVDLGHSALVSLNYVYALDRASELFTYFGVQDQDERLNARAREFLNQADRTRNAVYNLCMDFSKGMLADVPVDETEQHSLYKKGIHSQHTNIFGILTGASPWTPRRPRSPKRASS